MMALSIASSVQAAIAIRPGCAEGMEVASGPDAFSNTKKNSSVLARCCLCADRPDQRSCNASARALSTGLSR
jgi:hypothetical protein